MILINKKGENYHVHILFNIMTIIGKIYVMY